MANPVQSLEIKEQAQDIAATLPSLVLSAQRVADVVAQGIHGRHRAGSGEEFWQYRQYQQGDAARSIDWRRSAKSDQIYIKQREWEIPQTVWLWCDHSLSMRFSSDSAWPEKMYRAEILLLALVILLTKAGERVGLIGSEMTPSSARSTVNPMAAHLITQRTAPSDSIPNIDALSNNSRLVMISDFFLPTAIFQQNILNFAKRSGQGCLLQILDPAEEEFDWQGRILFQGLENNQKILIEKTQSIRTLYQHRLLAHRLELENTCRSLGWSFLHSHTNKPAVATLITLYGLLNKQGKS